MEGDEQKNSQTENVSEISKTAKPDDDIAVEIIDAKKELSPSEKNALFDRLAELKNDVRELRNKLNEVNDMKETWFNKKEELNSKISNMISDIKSSKQARNAFTKQVKEDKKTREDLNKNIKDKISEIKKLNQEKTQIMQKYKITSNPSMIKEEMNRLERKIETEAMSFDKEKKLMKAIKDLKKRYDEVRKVTDVWDRTRSISKDLDKLKQQANESHNKIQSKAKESQTKHEKMLNIAGDVDKLKQEERTAFEKFVEYKKQFTEINNQLKAKLTELNDVNSKVNEFRQLSKSEKKRKEEEVLRIKGSDVKEKIKKRQKLTTEDLLVFQKTETDKE